MSRFQVLQSLPLILIGAIFWLTESENDRHFSFLHFFYFIIDKKRTIVFLVYSSRNLSLRVFLSLNLTPTLSEGTRESLLYELFYSSETCHFDKFQFGYFGKKGPNKIFKQKNLQFF